MHKVFLVVPMGVNVHVDVGIVMKLDYVNLRIFLGCDDVHLRFARNGGPVTQLSFLTLSILQPVGRLEGSTHFGELPESIAKNKFLERRIWRDS